MKYPSVRGSNFIRFSILIHPSPNSNTLNEGTTPANRSSRISRSNEDCLARVACWSPEAAGRSGVSAFWPILSAPKVAFIPGKIELSSLVPTWSATINTRPLSSKMARKGHFTKKPKLGPGCQQPQTAPPPISPSHRDDSQILPDSGDSIPTTSRPFLPPRSVLRPAPQTSTNNIQDLEPSHVNSADNANYVDSVDQEADYSFVDSRAQNRKGRKTTEFWEVRIIDFDGTIKPARLSAR
ncbi:uncharacterized protein [Arachis hypogaea]|uniref:uncharacterized protein isoform X1 n=1 Tax=Arachis hypogaea TaxID=3818 RepID=UPI003B21DE57